jgi:hypothetical protein
MESYSVTNFMNNPWVWKFLESISISWYSFTKIFEFYFPNWNRDLHDSFVAFQPYYNYFPINSKTTFPQNVLQENSANGNLIEFSRVFILENKFQLQLFIRKKVLMKFFDYSLFREISSRGNPHWHHLWITHIH